MSIEINNKSKVIKTLKKVGVHHIWRVFLKVGKGIQATKYPYLVGLPKSIKLLNKTSNEEVELEMRGYKHPMYLRMNTSDINVFQDIFIQNEYKIKIPFKPKVIFDVGANNGFSTVYFANRFPRAKIIAIEPEETNFKVLKKNTIKYKNIICVKGGLWSRNSKLKITNLESNRHWSFRVDEVSNKEKGFKGYSIDFLMKKYKLKNIDILKMDIEGSEKEVFQNNYKEWLCNTKLGFVEVHERYAKGVTKLVDKRLNEFNFKQKKSGEKLVFYK